MEFVQSGLWNSSNTCDGLSSRSNVMNLDRRLSSEQVATGLKLIWDEDTQGHHGPFDLNMPVKALFDGLHD